MSHTHTRSHVHHTCMVRSILVFCCSLIEPPGRTTPFASTSFVGCAHPFRRKMTAFLMLQLWSVRSVQVRMWRIVLNESFTSKKKIPWPTSPPCRWKGFMLSPKPFHWLHLNDVDVVFRNNAFRAESGFAIASAFQSHIFLSVDLSMVGIEAIAVWQIPCNMHHVHLKLTCWKLCFDTVRILDHETFYWN